MRGLSDFLAFLVILIIIVVVLIPLTIYVLNPPNLTSPQSNQELYNAQFINITYVISQGTGYLYLSYPSSLSQPQIINVYNYSNGVWVAIQYSQVSVSQSGQTITIIYQIQGYPPRTLMVQISYAGQTNFIVLYPK